MGGNSDLPLEILQNVLDDAESCGFDELSFTGGEPTVHANFPEVLRLTCDAGYKFVAPSRLNVTTATSLFPCASLNLEELNIDRQGNLTKCCHLSRHRKDAGQDDVIGNLGDMKFSEAFDKLVEENRQFRELNIKHLQGSEFRDSDFFPCWYCSVYYRKLGWLKSFKGHPCSELIWDPTPAGVDGLEITPAPTSRP